MNFMVVGQFGQLGIDYLLVVVCDVVVKRWLFDDVVGDVDYCGVEVFWQCDVVVFGFFMDWLDGEVVVQYFVIIFMYQMGSVFYFGIGVGVDVFLNEIDKVCFVL